MNTARRRLRSATATGSSHGTSSPVNRLLGSVGCQSAGSIITTGEWLPDWSRSAASLSSRWRRARGSSAAVGPGSTGRGTAGGDDHVVLEQSHH